MPLPPSFQKSPHFDRYLFGLIIVRKMFATVAAVSLVMSQTLQDVVKAEYVVCVIHPRRNLGTETGVENACPIVADDEVSVAGDDPQRILRMQLGQ